MKFTLGIKQNMTQLFDEEGKVYPVTVFKLNR
jgi:ribosomal protein L3